MFLQDEENAILGVPLGANQSVQATWKPSDVFLVSLFWGFAFS